MIDGGCICKRCGTWHTGNHSETKCYNIIINNLKAKVEDMKCCGNCSHYIDGYKNDYEKCSKHDTSTTGDNICDNWGRKSI